MTYEFALEKILEVKPFLQGFGHRPQDSRQIQEADDFSTPKLDPTQPVLLELPITSNLRQAEAMSVPIALDPIKEELKRFHHLVNGSQVWIKKGDFRTCFLHWLASPTCTHNPMDLSCNLKIGMYLWW